MDNFSFLNAAHSGFFSQMYEQYLEDPDTLEPSWKAFFQGYDFANSDFLKGEIVEGVSPQIPDSLQKEFNHSTSIVARFGASYRFTCSRYLI